LHILGELDEIVAYTLCHGIGLETFFAIASNYIFWGILKKVPQIVKQFEAVFISA
jgi:hypothetical protein